MAYLGNSTSLYDPTRSSPSTPQVFSGNGSTLTFTLQRSVGCSTDIFVMVENVVQQPDYAYTASGNQLTFTAAPGAGTNNIYVVYEKVTGLTSVVPDGSITSSKLANNIRLLATDQYIGTGTTTQWTLSDTPYDANSLIVTINGVGQAAPVNYTVSGNTIVFTSAPNNGANVVVRNVGFRTTQTLYALSSNSSVVQPVITGGSITNSSISGGTANNLTIANSTFSGGLSGNNITANTISNTAFQMGSVENYMSAQGSQIGGNRNKIINGAMMIDQRNAGASVAITTSDNYITDRFVGIVSANSKLTGQQNAGSVTPPVGFVNYLGMTVAASANVTVGATDLYVIGQQIEGLNCSDLAWGTASAATVTLSFWVRSSITGTFGGSLRNSGATRSYPFTYTISAANTWEQKSVTIAGDTSGTWLTTNGIGIRLLFGLGVGSTYSGTAGSWAGANYVSATGATKLIETNGATFYITGVQLEKGATATPFENRLYGTELALCQRYYQNYNDGNGANIGIGYCSNTTTCYPVFCFAGKMRAIPSFSYTGGITIGGYGTATAIALDSASTVNASLNLTGSGMAAAQARQCWMNASSSISFSAEL